MKRAKKAEKASGDFDWPELQGLIPLPSSTQAPEPSTARQQATNNHNSGNAHKEAPSDHHNNAMAQQHPSGAQGPPRPISSHDEIRGGLLPPAQMAQVPVQPQQHHNHHGTFQPVIGPKKAKPNAGAGGGNSGWQWQMPHKPNHHSSGVGANEDGNNQKRKVKASPAPVAKASAAAQLALVQPLPTANARPTLNANSITPTPQNMMSRPSSGNQATMRRDNNEFVNRSQPSVSFPQQQQPQQLVGVKRKSPQRVPLMGKQPANLALSDSAANPSQHNQQQSSNQPQQQQRQTHPPPALSTAQQLSIAKRIHTEMELAAQRTRDAESALKAARRQQGVLNRRLLKTLGANPQSYEISLLANVHLGETAAALQRHARALLSSAIVRSKQGANGNKGSNDADETSASARLAGLRPGPMDQVLLQLPRIPTTDVGQQPQQHQPQLHHHHEHHAASPVDSISTASSYREAYSPLSFAADGCSVDHFPRRSAAQNGRAGSWNNAYCEEEELVNDCDTPVPSARIGVSDSRSTQLDAQIAVDMVQIFDTMFDAQSYQLTDLKTPMSGDVFHQQQQHGGRQRGAFEDDDIDSPSSR